MAALYHLVRKGVPFLIHRKKRKQAEMSCQRRNNYHEIENYWKINIYVKSSVKDHQVPVYLFGYDNIWFKKCGIYKNLESIDKAAIENLFSKNICLPEKVKEVLILMKVSGKKAEQEILIDHLGDKKLEQWLTQNSIKMERPMI